MDCNSTSSPFHYSFHFSLMLRLWFLCSLSDPVSLLVSTLTHLMVPDKKRSHRVTLRQQLFHFLVKALATPSWTRVFGPLALNKALCLLLTNQNSISYQWSWIEIIADLHILLPGLYFKGSSESISLVDSFISTNASFFESVLADRVSHMTMMTICVMLFILTWILLFFTIGK